MQTREMWGQHVPGRSSIFNARRECVVQITGGAMGTGNPGWLESQRVLRHLYCVEWIPITTVIWSKTTYILMGCPGQKSTGSALSHAGGSSARLVFMLPT